MVVVGLDPEGLAAYKGIQVRDVITEVDQERVTSLEQFVRSVSKLEEGQFAFFWFWRPDTGINVRALGIPKIKTMTHDLKGTDALLMIGSSERCANLFYATRFRAPDPFVFLWTPSEKIMLAHNLEIDRARDQACVNRVLPYARYEKRAKERGQERPNGNVVLLENFCADLGLEKLQVPADFPLGTADFLRGEDIELAIAADPLFPQRKIKDAEEIAVMRRAMRAAEAGMETAIEGATHSRCARRCAFPRQRHTHIRAIAAHGASDANGLRQHWRTHHHRRRRPRLRIHIK